MMLRAHCVVASLCCVLPVGQVAAQAGDAQFREVFVRQYDQLKGVKPDMLVEELRLRVELVASRGSQIGAASNDKRLRGFETLLLQNLQAALCHGSSAAGSRPSLAVLDSVTQAAKGQRLRTEGGDVAELSAIAQRLIDGQAPARLCSVTSLDEVR